MDHLGQCQVRIWQLIHFYSAFRLLCLNFLHWSCSIIGSFYVGSHSAFSLFTFNLRHKVALCCIAQSNSVLPPNNSYSIGRFYLRPLPFPFVFPSRLFCQIPLPYIFLPGYFPFKVVRHKWTSINSLWAVTTGRNVLNTHSFPIDC